MKQVYHIWITVYSKPEDNESEIVSNLLKLFPFKLEDEKIVVQRSSAMGFEDRKIIIFQVHLEKTRHISKFLEYLLSKLDEGQKRLIGKQLESRLDSENHFFLRFDKDKLIKENCCHMTDTGNCYHIKMSIAAFPNSRENALKVVKNMFLQ